jgi:hypothetical protein
VTDDPLPRPGTEVTIVKLRPDGSEAASYPGLVLPGRPGWLVARATWARPRLDLGYLVFEPDDVFIEYFALDAPFNAFALFGRDEELKGWYCNVTEPTRVEGSRVSWRDLYLDVIVYPDGRQLLLDEDELEESGLDISAPDRYQVIREGAAELARRARHAEYPFCDLR